MDIVDRATRSRMMSRIRGYDTNPELTVRSHLHQCGLRFRLHVSGLPGRPDIVLPKWKAVVFVHGCFWHRHPYCPFAYMPASNRSFWEKKFEDNVARDQRNQAALRQAGWRVFTVWECQINQRYLNRLVRRIRNS